MEMGLDNGFNLRSSNLHIITHVPIEVSHDNLLPDRHEANHDGNTGLQLVVLCAYLKDVEDDEAGRNCTEGGHDPFG